MPLKINIEIQDKGTFTVVVSGDKELMSHTGDDVIRWLEDQIDTLKMMSEDHKKKSFTEKIVAMVIGGKR